jgi:hypothetical protein
LRVLVEGPEARGLFAEAVGEHVDHRLPVTDSIHFIRTGGTFLGLK